MRTIKIIEHMSLDGIISPGARGEYSPGRGIRLFSDSVDPREFTFVSSKSTPTGVMLNTYRHVGVLKS